MRSLRADSSELSVSGALIHAHNHEPPTVQLQSRNKLATGGNIIQVQVTNSNSFELKPHQQISHFAKGGNVNFNLTSSAE